jgi:hypothetical protein
MSLSPWLQAFLVLGERGTATSSGEQLNLLVASIGSDAAIYGLTDALDAAARGGSGNAGDNLVEGAFSVIFGPAILTGHGGYSEHVLYRR